MRILATSGGFLPSDTGPFHWRRGPLIEHALHLAGRPRPAAFLLRRHRRGDSLNGTAGFYRAFAGSDVRASPPRAVRMPNVPDVRAHLLAQDVIWVGGGSVANLLAVWRVHGLDEILRECWEAGRGPRRRLGRLDLLVRRRPDRQLRPRPAAVPARARPAALRQRRPLRQRGASAARCCTRWSPTARCPPRTPPTTAWGWSTTAPSWSRRSPTGPASRRTSWSGSADGTVAETRIEPRLLG